MFGMVKRYSMAKKSHRKLKMWNCYHIKFLDHCCGYKKLMECSVVGWLTSETENSYTFSHWIVDNDPDAKVDNLEPTTLAKELIISAKKLF